MLVREELCERRAELTEWGIIGRPGAPHQAGSKGHQIRLDEAHRVGCRPGNPRLQIFRIAQLCSLTLRPAHSGQVVSAPPKAPLYWRTPRRGPIHRVCGVYLFVNEARCAMGSSRNAFLWARDRWTCPRGALSFVLTGYEIRFMVYNPPTNTPWGGFYEIPYWRHRASVCASLAGGFFGDEEVFVSASENELQPCVALFWYS